MRMPARGSRHPQCCRGTTLHRAAGARGRGCRPAIAPRQSRQLLEIEAFRGDAPISTCKRTPVRRLSSGPMKKILPRRSRARTPRIRRRRPAGRRRSPSPPERPGRPARHHGRRLLEPAADRAGEKREAREQNHHDAGRGRRGDEQPVHAVAVEPPLQRGEQVVEHHRGDERDQHRRRIGGHREYRRPGQDPERRGRLVFLAQREARKRCAEAERRSAPAEHRET